MRRVLLAFVLTSVLSTQLVFAPSVSAQRDYFLFESDPVRPLAISADGNRLFACNTPDGRVEVFDISGGGAVHTESIPVGMEPVAVNIAPDGHLWVVNHLSDSVSIVDVTTTPATVTQTLLVGDEPRDVVFGGDVTHRRAFITTAHRGQHSPYPDGEYTTPGVGRADVWVFDIDALGAAGGDEETIVTLFGDRPRALTVSADGQTVYAAVYRSGNRTTVVPAGVVCPGDPNTPCDVMGVTYPGGLPLPTDNHANVPGPQVGLIVQYDEGSGEWRDELDRDWSPAVRFELPDSDVFAIDAAAETVSSTGAMSGVGTILFNMAVNPQNGRVYVSNTEARNEVRFEGHGTYAAAFKPAGEPASVRGHLHEARVTVLNPGTGDVTPRHLNPHIDYDADPVAPGVGDRSFAQPMGMAVSDDGATLFLAAFGSQEVAFIDTAALEAGTYAPATDPTTDRARLTGGGPTGVLLDATGSRLFVATRFNNAVSVVDVATRGETAVLPLHSPEPDHIVHGRPFLYDARLSSSNGESSCGSCHVFGDMDDLAWELGDPDGDVLRSINPAPVIGGRLPFHPMKGPMTTQSLRGMANAGPMHWRGDRTGGSDCGDPLDEIAAFMAFSGAFEGLLGRDEGALSEAEMRAFTDFALQLTYPPNPVRQLSNDLRPNEAAGENTYFNSSIDMVTTCDGCHGMDREQGFFGANGSTSFENEPQEFKVAHLRNVYQKVGMFGMPAVPFLRPFNTSPMGPQIRGYGYLHDGAIDTVQHFFFATVFFYSNATQRDNVTAFMMAFDSNMAPIVGQQVTLTDTNDADEMAQLALLREGAAAEQVRVGGGTEHECDLIASAVVSGERRGYVWEEASDMWQSDRLATQLSHGELVALLGAGTTAITFTCVPPGTGYRAGVDRDSDFALDGDERDSATSTTDATDVPSSGLMPGTLVPPDLGPTPEGCPAPDMGVADQGPVIDGGADTDAGAGTDQGSTPDLGTTPSGSSGCGCRAAPGAPLPHAWLLGVLGLGLWWRRRRTGPNLPS